MELEKEISETNEILLSLAKKYVSKEDILIRIEEVIVSSPERVSIRGIYELINQNKDKEFSEIDKDILKDFLSYFG